MSPDLSAKSQGPSHDECLFRKEAHLTRYWCSTFLRPHGLIRYSLMVETSKYADLLLKPGLKTLRGLFANGLLPQLQVKVSQASSGYQCHRRKWETRSSAHHFHNQVPSIRDRCCHSPHTMKFLSHCAITFG